jgi:uncharacterized repeat protein (TIGR01451 family)
MSQARPNPSEPTTNPQHWLDHMLPHNTLLRLGARGIFFLIYTVAVALIGGTAWSVATQYWHTQQVARAADERFCTFGNESSVRSSDDTFHIKTVDGPSYFPSVCTNKQTVKRGDTITYGLRVTNNGSEEVPAFLVSSHLPDGVSYVPGSSHASIDGENDVEVADGWLQDGSNLGGLARGDAVRY